MTEELMVGTLGWDYDEWVENYYSDDLPDDWRFAYYSNDHRSVLVPADHIKLDVKDAASEWAEDCDEEFRFVVEIPKNHLLAADEATLQSYVKSIASLQSHLAGFYISLGSITKQEIALLQTRVSQLQKKGPLCIDYDRASEASDALRSFASENNIGVCWHADVDSKPATGGSLMLTLSDEQNPKAQRTIIEALEEWMQQSNGIAGLFLKTPAAASQARIIAEMLGI